VVCDAPATAAYLERLLDGTSPQRRPVSRWRILLGHLPGAVAHRAAFVALGAYRRLLASTLLGKPSIGHRYAILSFAYGRSFRRGYEDVVFGPLVPWLGAHGYAPAIIPLVIPPTSYAGAVRGMRAAGKTFLVPEVFEPWGGRILLALSSLLHPPAPLPAMIFHGMRVEEILVDDLIRDWKGRRALESRILGESVRRLCTGRMFEALTYPFENHAWEKAVCSAVRSVSGRTTLIGFQHSTIYSTLLNYFIAPCESTAPFLPHRIVTSGSRAHDLLAHSGYPGGMIRRGGAIRFLRGNEGAAPAPKSGPFTILVAPTVDINESTELIIRVLDACADLPEVQIVIRCHPDLPFDHIAPLLEQPLPRNATAGPGSMAQLQDAGVLVFASTSVAMEALSMGVPVIQITTMDPLIGNRFEGFSPSRMLQFAHNDGELRRMVDALRTSGITSGDRSQAQEIVRQFFGPVDETVYAQFLPENRG
jgi:hypothetical protein